MTTSHKYNRSEGCSICATKNSTSQFRPWYDHYTEETYCRVFRLDVFDGRRGFVCNPCVLYIKRAIQSLDFPTPEQQINPPDHTRRLDCKLKGDIRPVIHDIWPVDGMGSSVPAAPSKEKGFFYRHMTIHPRYVYTGKPSIRLKTKHQLVPAGRWRDPREYMEREDNAEKDLKHMRLFTLKKGVKTIHDKQEELRRKEARENARLFGEIGDFRSKGKGLKQEGQHSEYHTRAKCKEVDVKTPSKIATPAKKGKNSRVHGTRGNFSRVKRIHEGDDDSEGVEETSSEDEDNLEGRKSPSVSTEDVDESASVSSSIDLKRITEEAPCKKRKNLCAEDDSLVNPMKQLRCDEDDSEEMKDKDNDQQSVGSVDSTHVPTVNRKGNRRFPGCPVKDKKPPNVSFMDTSYFLKIPMCCMDMYLGEGGMAVVRPRSQQWSCPVMAEQVAKRKRQEKKRKTKAAAAAAKQAADSTKAKIAKETEVSKESEVSSPWSSGDDELNDSRCNFNSSPLVEASLMVDAFHFFGEQGKGGKAGKVAASF
ncbi:ABC transporter F family member 4-like [Littorina saxatilis]|uniref:Uncharacterized protein n=1 Tax=Littorina saxatilis TaxID=31220 RepID=A0AAN9GHC0_9CAEN